MFRYSIGVITKNTGLGSFFHGAAFFCSWLIVMDGGGFADIVIDTVRQKYYTINQIQKK